MDLCGYSNVEDQNICTDWQLVSGYFKLTIFGFVRIITDKDLSRCHVSILTGLLNTYVVY